MYSTYYTSCDSWPFYLNLPSLLETLDKSAQNFEIENITQKYSYQIND